MIETWQGTFRQLRGEPGNGIVLAYDVASDTGTVHLSVGNASSFADGPGGADGSPQIGTRVPCILRLYNFRDPPVHNSVPTNASELNGPLCPDLLCNRDHQCGTSFRHHLRDFR